MFIVIEVVFRFRAQVAPLISSVMESLMSSQDRLYRALDGAKYPQTKTQAIEDLENYPTCFCRVEQCSQSKTV